MISLNPNQIEEAANRLRAGEVLIYPTETSYGIGCLASSEQAIDRIIAIKGRDQGKGMVVLIPAPEAAGAYIEVSEKGTDLIKTHWPGPLNIIAKSKNHSSIHQKCTADGYQALRVSSHPFVQALMSILGAPIISTSANPSGKDPIYSADDLHEAFIKTEPDAIIDAGTLPKNATSTTVLIKSGEVTVLRQGNIKL